MAIACVRPYGAFSAAAQCPHNLIIGRNSHVPPHFICLAQPRQACLATCQTMPAVPCQTPEEGVAPLWHCQRDLSRCVGRSCCRLRRYRFALIARTGGEQRRISLRSDTAPALRWLANAVRRSCSMKPSACIGPRPARARTTSGMARQHCLRRSKSPPKDHRGAFKTASADRVSRLHEQRHRGFSGPPASRSTTSTPTGKTSIGSRPAPTCTYFSRQQARPGSIRSRYGSRLAGEVAQRRLLHKPQTAPGAHRCLYQRK